MYDPSIGRWNGVDALSEKYLSLSPFAYGANNPMVFIDVNGDSLRLTIARNFEKFENLLSGAFAGKVAANVNRKTGITTFSIVEEQELNEQESIGFSILNRITNDAVTIEIQLADHSTPGSENVTHGNWVLEALDLDDIGVLLEDNNPDGMTARGVLVHEIVEQYLKQMGEMAEGRQFTYPEDLELFGEHHEQAIKMANRVQNAQVYTTRGDKFYILGDNGGKMRFQASYIKNDDGDVIGIRYDRIEE